MGGVHLFGRHVCDTVNGAILRANLHRIAQGVHGLVAVLWLVPDRRIESALVHE